MWKSIWCGALLSGLSAAGCAAHSTSEVASASAGCNQLGDTSGVVATAFAPGNVYGAAQREQTQPKPYEVRGTHSGTVLYVRATPGVSKEYLERALVCHTAYGRSLNASDPLHPSRGTIASVQVQSAGSGYAVRIIGDERETDEDVYLRARALSSPGTVSVEQVASVKSNRAE
jgi:hypothetical protein